MQTTAQLFSGAELERVHNHLVRARLKREAWQGCYTRLMEAVQAAHMGNKTRVDLQLLEAIATRASKSFAVARVEEEAAAVRYLKVTGGLS